MIYNVEESISVENKRIISYGSCGMKVKNEEERKAFETALLYRSFEQVPKAEVNFQRAKDSYLMVYGQNARLLSHEVVEQKNSQNACSKNCSFYTQIFFSEGVNSNWCKAFPLASVFTMKPFPQKTICYLVGDRAPEECKACRKHASKELRRIYVKDLRFWGHPATVVLQYYPVEKCPVYQEIINKKLSGVHPRSGKNVKRFSNRLVKAVNSFLILDDPDISNIRLRFISEACDMSRNTLKHWRDREQSNAKQAYDEHLAAQHLQMEPVANQKLSDGNLATHFLYTVRSENAGAALADMHAAEDWENLYEAMAYHHPRAVNRIDMKPPGFFNLAYDFLLFTYPEIPTALGALLLTYLRFHLRYEDVFFSVAEQLYYKFYFDYYYDAMGVLLETYWNYHARDKSKDNIIEFLKLSSRKLVPCRKEYERGTSTAAIRAAWNECRRLAREAELAVRATPKRVPTQKLKKDHAELCSQIAQSTLPKKEIAERLLAFNHYALSDVEHYRGMEHLAGIRFTEHGDFIKTFSHLKVDGGMPLDELLPMVRRGLLNDESDEMPAAADDLAEPCESPE